MIDGLLSILFHQKMKVRDSGMPEVEYWETLFDIPLILSRMKIDSALSDVVEVGCGYGTFTIPTAKIVRGIVHTFDIEPEMVQTTVNRAAQHEISNVKATLRDFIDEGSGLADDSIDYIMLFNILHHDNPAEIFRESLRILKPGGFVGCIHWNYDPSTPRGPKMEIRPKPDEIRNWMISAGLHVDGSLIDLPPYHYGWLGRKLIFARTF